MNIIKGKICDIYELSFNEKLPEELINSPGQSLVLQNGNLFKLQNINLHTCLSSFNPKISTKEFLENEIGQPTYDTNNVYLLKENWNEFRFPIEKFKYVMKYFQQIYDKYRVEAGVYLMVNTETKKWEVLFVPQVDCSGTSVNYLMPTTDISTITDRKSRRLYQSVFDDDKAKDLMERSVREYNRLYDAGFRIFGTIHSHCNFGAFHSGVDDADEKHFDGLHITIGNVRSGFSYSARYMIQTVPFNVDIAEILGVSSMDELKDNLDDIKIDQFHLDLMMPELGKNRPYFDFDRTTSLVDDWGKAVKKYYSGHFSQRSCNYSNEYDWDNESEFSWASGESSNLSGNQNSLTAESNIFSESDVVRMYDITEDECFIVTKQFVAENEDYFRKYCVIVPFGEVPNNVKKKHKKWLRTRNKDEKDNANVETQKKTGKILSSITFISNPEINPRHKNSYLAKIGHIVQGQLHIKASKKDTHASQKV
jgi:hypothetical protein